MGKEDSVETLQWRQYSYLATALITQTRQSRENFWNRFSVLSNTLSLVSVNHFVFVIASLRLSPRGKRSSADDGYRQHWMGTCSAVHWSIRPSPVSSPITWDWRKVELANFRENSHKATDYLTLSSRKRRISDDSRAGGDGAGGGFGRLKVGLCIMWPSLCCDRLPLISCTAGIRCPPSRLSESQCPPTLFLPAILPFLASLLAASFFCDCGKP